MNNGLNNQVTPIQTATTTATGDAYPFMCRSATFEAEVTGTGAVSATVVIEATDGGSVWTELGTITLSGTTSAADSFPADGPSLAVRSRVTAISGTSASVTTRMAQV